MIRVAHFLLGMQWPLVDGGTRQVNVDGEAEDFSMRESVFELWHENTKETQDISSNGNR